MLEGHKQNPYIIDVEASGFGLSSYPIEVGIVLEPEVKFCTLITPAEEWVHWDNEAERIHGITRDCLFQHGKPINVVADELNRFLSGKTIYSDGWVVDKPWLITLYEQANIDMEFHISPIEMLLKEEQMLIWDKTKQEVIEKENVTRHRASNDAWIIQTTFNRTLEQLSKETV